jgi:DNA-binding XRE family transcriptional regulator
VAKNINVHESTLARIEHGEVWPSKKTVENLVSFFDNNINEIEILWPERFIN